MEEIAISKFKATCLAVLEKVRKTGKPVVITKFGQPVAQISPTKIRRVPRLGGGIGEIVGDIVSPIGDESDWEAANEPVGSGERRTK